jgi:hypothetical protein
MALVWMLVTAVAVCGRRWLVTTTLKQLRFVPDIFRQSYVTSSTLVKRTFQPLLTMVYDMPSTVVLYAAATRWHS